MSDIRRAEELIRLLDTPDFIRLAECYGGTRLYVPADGDTSALARKLGRSAAEKLARRYAGSYIRVPLAREVRARQYRADGRSNAEIARRLGITETGVDKLFQRMPSKPAKGSGDPRQPDLFAAD